VLTYDIEKLERARVIRGWTKGRLARAVGLTPSAISFVWKGQAKKAETLKHIAEVLGLTVEEILIERKDGQYGISHQNKS